MIKQIFTMANITITALVLLTGCSNTFEGAGRDIENAGKKIQENF